MPARAVRVRCVFWCRLCVFQRGVVVLRGRPRADSSGVFYYSPLLYQGALYGVEKGLDVLGNNETSA